jgi:hypothetical protein
MANLPMKLTALSTDSEVAGASKELLFAVKFTENRKHNFETTLKIMEKADVFMSATQGKKMSYLVAFSKTVPQAKLAMAVLEEMRIAGWKYIMFANGRVQLRKIAMTNMLDCFCTATRLKDPTKHCHRIYDDPAERFVRVNSFKFNVAELIRPHANPDVSWKLPCQNLEGFISVSAEEFANPLPYIEAAAETRLVNCCPLFDASAFEAKASLGKAKKYWD